MSELIEQTLDPHAGHEGDVDHDTSHDWLYVKIAAVLAAITAAEISLPYITDVEGPVVAVMLIMMVLKFFLVGAYFMHLKFESKLFRQVFVAGIVLAVLVYLAALATFHFFE